MRFIELFAGIGGFRYGLEAISNQHTTTKSGQTESEIFIRGERNAVKRGDILHAENLDGVRKFDCVYANEWDKYAASIYRRHYGEIDERDITTVNVRDIPTHDLLVGGFPCQAFSIAGNRLGFEDTRGTLFFEIARIIKHHRPRHLLLEKVKGLLSHEQGKTFTTILGVLSDLGYRVEWMVLNSKHFGVPQNRERVFIVGHLKGECAGKIFPIIGSSGETDDFAYCLDAHYHKGATDLKKHNRTVVFEPELREITSENVQSQRVYSPDGLAQTINGEAGGQGAKTGLYAMRGRDDGQQLELRGNETNSLTSVSKDNLWLEGTRIRRLTPVECERLQAFPDGWTAQGLQDSELVEISDTQRYKCLGNAVTTNVISAIGEALLEADKKAKEKENDDLRPSKTPKRVLCNSTRAIRRVG